MDSEAQSVNPDARRVVEDKLYDWLAHKIDRSIIFKRTREEVWQIIAQGVRSQRIFIDNIIKIGKEVDKNARKVF